MQRLHGIEMLGSRHLLTLRVLSAAGGWVRTRVKADCGNGVELECLHPPTNPRYPMHHENPSWSRQGLIAYEDYGIDCVDSLSGGFQVNDSLSGIWILNPDTNEAHRLVATNPPFGGRPSWSPQGAHVVFSSGSQLFTITSDGSGLTQLTSEGRHRFPSWGPRGDWIAYDDTWRLWLIRPDGNDRRNIGEVQQPEVGSRMPSWSPDGSRIVHIRYVN